MKNTLLGSLIGRDTSFASDDLQFAMGDKYLARLGN